MARVVTFGELMMRLNPPAFQRFSQARQFEFYFVGGEANVAASCAGFGHDVSYVTALPDNEIAAVALRHLRYWGVDTSHIVTAEGRLGVFYVENGASQRASVVVYDRAYSSVSLAAPSVYDWPAILKGAAWFHTTGISPAISDNAARATLEALRTAKAAGATTSFDLNYRRKLWSREQAKRTVEPMLKHVDLLIGNEEDAKDVLGIEAAHTDVDAGKLDHAAYRRV
jgi:2-dehydro-3-deoxygluconokinase